MASATTTPEDALAHAKAIMAGINNQTSETPAASTATATPTRTTKRKRWGVAAPAPAPAASPSSSPAAPSEALPGLSDASKKMKEAKEPMSKRFWLTTTPERTENHYYVYLPERLEYLQKDIGKNANGESAALSLKGKGATGTAPLPGVPEEPMNVLLEAPPDLFHKAEDLVNALLDEAEKAPLAAEGPLPPAPGAPPAEADGPSNALALQSSYRPATVAQLIANSTNPMAGGGNVLEEKVHVPNGVVGFVIGRGGETITSLQARTGCKVQIQKEHELSHGQTQRVITLSASTQEAIDECRQLIMDMVKERVQAAGGGKPGQDGKVLEAMASGHVVITLDVPDADVGLIIGKGGSTIKSIQESTGSSIQIPPNGGMGNPAMRSVSITSPTEQGAQEAKKQIEELLQNKVTHAKPSNHYQHQHQQQRPSQLTVQVPIPDKDVGLCIGRQGCVIKEMQRKSNTKIQIPGQTMPGQQTRIATVVGSQQGIDMVREMVNRISQEQSSASVMSGTPHGAQTARPFHQGHAGRGHGPPHQVQGHYGHQQGGRGYGSGPNVAHGVPAQAQAAQTSPEWQAYYAAQAVAGQQQQQQQQPGAAAGAGAQSDDQYHEQFFRYAYYYGEEAARSYYGAWSPPLGTPNPYGVNPNGVTAPPPSAAPAGANAQAGQAPGQGPQAAATQAARPAAQAQDSSVRKVSNLPAWMTKAN
mmetsp:Transcript_9661/g.27487  ORF Transcript_9661/g.27487 Transcript_9661/m.27487 type:complete len:702 (-) Transcript_9661:1490-3595(-)|eukprot:CAMPEP_0119554220 /NCGR_PEP_ID=MMETSP1352-20130426/6777_1 /TAXON_ID=265584 /ORGANISM="Stauroneis constricta, Strain CCMP1120" /LENGTH=701 /DNA_ID=CAMNT_0007600781 /DNA_START=86 /DNA_END=2191 /DNA_ORIENTATION=-